jgi:hypothetical protein
LDPYPEPVEAWIHGPGSTLKCHGTTTLEGRCHVSSKQFNEKGEVLECLVDTKWCPWLPPSLISRHSRRPKISFEINMMNEITEQRCSVAEDELNMANIIQMVWTVAD